MNALEEGRLLRSVYMNVEESPGSRRQGTECKLRLATAGVSGLKDLENRF